MSATRQQVLKLYKNLMRENNKFASYNYRTYALRRTRDAFRENKTAKSDQVPDLIEKAQHNLEIIKRQVVISQMYTTEPIVVEQRKHQRHQADSKAESS